MYCIKCGQKIENDSLFCEFCGAKQPERKMTDVQIPMAETEPIIEEKTESVSESSFEQVVEPTEETNIVKPVAEETSLEETVSSENFVEEQTESAKEEYESADEIIPAEPIYEPIIERIEPKKKFPLKKIGIIAAITVVLIAITVGLLSINADERKIYREAKGLMESGLYYSAEYRFSTIPGFRKSDELYLECFNKARYNDAKSRMEKGDSENVQEAINLLNQIIDYEDSKELIDECNTMLVYNQAIQNMEDMYYEQAENLFESISDYKDSAEKAETCRLFQSYVYANLLYKAQKYEEAMVEYKALGDFEDSKDFVELCEKGIKYNEAIELYEAESYDEAKAIFDELSDFEEAKKYSTWCDCIPKYEEGLALFNKDKYKESLEYLKDCADADYLDSKDLYSKAEKYQYYEEDYQAALKLYNAGKYYSAKVAFEKLGDYKDSAKKAESCVRSKPSSGEIYHNSNYKSSSVSLKITAPSSTNTFLKIYCGSDLACTVFIRAGGSTTIHLPSGTYTIDADYGSTWYGTTETFGPNGSYCTLLNGSSTKFSLSSGSWSLQLLASTTGNVGSKSRSWGS